jgi:integrase
MSENTHPTKNKPKGRGKPKRIGRRTRGDGSLFQKKGSKLWTLQYNDQDGNRVRQPSGTADWPTAKEMLAEAVAKVRKGKPGYVPDSRSVKVSDLYEDLKRETEELVKRGKRKARAVEALSWRWNNGRWGHGHLKDAFGDMPAAKVTTLMTEEYKSRRLDEGAQLATVHRELRALNKMYKLAKKHKRIELGDGPIISMEKEDNARTGFIDDAEFDRLTAVAGELWLRLFLEMLYAFAMRRGELLGLLVEDVDFSNGTIHLKDTKNGDDRIVPMTPKVEELLRAAVAGKKPTDFVFTWGPGKGKKKAEGTPVRWFEPEWKRLFADAGVRLRLVHDFRRSAARAMRNDGTSDIVIMKIGGWKTMDTLHRYQIVDLTDQKRALKEKEENRKRKRELRELELKAPSEAVSPRLAPGIQ